MTAGKGKHIDEALVKRLRQARDDVCANRTAWKEAQKSGFAPELERAWKESHDRLKYNLGVLKRDVRRLTGKQYITISDKTLDMWDVALLPNLLNETPQTLAIRLNLLHQLEFAISEALSLAEDGETSELGGQPQILRIFISHGGRTSARDRLEKFIRALGADPVIVEDQPNLGSTPSAKVQREIERCHYGVVLAKLERSASQDGKPLPRGNIIDERARMAAALGDDRVLLLVEK